jgi:exopolyphosphatase/guanosine-5'-triphosphate,3'-diphosphate pyrophosphatase
METPQFSLSPDLVPRFAAIDIGTNSIRLIVAEAQRRGNYRILDDEKAPTRLGRNLSQTGRLDPAAVLESLDALRRMRAIAQGYQVCRLQAIATCAVREAQDGDEFCRRAFEETGVQIEVISSEREAFLAFYGVTRNFDVAGKNVAVADIGGGSTEIILANGSVIETTYATPLGAVRLTEQFLAGSAPADEELASLVDGIDRTLKRKTRKPPFYPHLLIGSGGTFTTLATMVMAQRQQVGLPVQAYQVTHAEVRHLFDRLAKMSAKARKNVPGLSSDRADIIVAGLAVIDRVMRRFRVNRLQVHAGGVRDGLLLTMVDDALGGEMPPEQGLADAVDRFATSCGTDVAHGRHVARLAVSIHSQLIKPFNLSPSDGRLLDAAARLQDVGYLINYDDHHKHSYHLILNSRLPGFGPQDLQIVANVARYHRGSMPKRKHDNFRQLGPADRRRVRQLAAILRVAIGLDRSHTQQVRDVQAVVDSNRVEFKAFADFLPEVDVWGARKRARAFEKVFGAPLHVDWACHETANSGR